MDKICRLCGLNRSSLVPVFSFDNGRIISDLITLIIPICIKMDEKNIPNNICQNCLDIIRTIHNLREKSVRNDTMFRSPSFQIKTVEKEDSTIQQNNNINENFEDKLSTTSSFVNDDDNENISNGDNSADDDDEWNAPLSKLQKDKPIKCKHCEESFNFQSSLARHIREYHQNETKKTNSLKAINCPICSLLIPQSTNFKRHIVQYHDNLLPYGCPHCTYKFSNIPALRHHGQKFHNNFDVIPAKNHPINVQVPVFYCDICGYKFIEKSSIMKHMSRKHNMKPFAPGNSNYKYHFNCEYCESQFSIRSNLFRHYQHAHSQELPYQCKDCKEGYRTQRLYNKHLAKIHFIENHNALPSTEARIPLSNEPLICEFCSEDCSNSRYRFERHLIIMHESELKEVLSCTQCSKKFVYKDSLDQHIAWHERKNTEKTYTFVCDMCTKRFSCEERLEKHKAGYHGGQSSLVCHICGRQMKNKCSLNFHIKRHSEKRDFACPQCPQSFVYIKELERHMNSHTDDRKYICTQEGCTKRFNDLYVFQLHKKRHAGLLEKKHHCTYCDKKFVSKYTLDRHILTHTQQRPHACEYCDMAYTQKNELVKHLRIHVGDNIYRCNFEGCTEGFRLKAELKQHYAVHYLN